MASLVQIQQELLAEIGIEELKFVSQLKELWHQTLSKPFFDSTTECTREFRGISLGEVARILGVDRGTLYRWMNKKTIPHAEKIFAIAVLVAKRDFSDFRFPNLNKAVMEAVRLCLWKTQTKWLQPSAELLPTRDQFLCLRNLVSHRQFAIFSDFAEEQWQVVLRVINDTLARQRKVFPDSTIQDGMSVVATWEEWGKAFCLFLLVTLNTATKEAIDDVE